MEPRAPGPSWGPGVLTFPHPAHLSLAQGTSDFCVAPDTFILNVTESQIHTGNSSWASVVHAILGAQARPTASQSVPLLTSFSLAVSQPLSTPILQVQMDLWALS